jgi:hypothetical protein
VQRAESSPLFPNQPNCRRTTCMREYQPLQLTKPSTQASSKLVLMAAKAVEWCVASMSLVGQKRRFDRAAATSGLPLSTDILTSSLHVAKVPTPEVTSLIQSPRRRGRGGREKLSRQGRSRSGVNRFMHRDLPKGGQLEDIANLHRLGLRRDHVDDLPRREAAGGRFG